MSRFHLGWIAAALLCTLTSCQTYSSSDMTLPSTKYLAHPPQYVPPTPPSPLQRQAASMVPAGATSTPAAPALPLTPSATPPSATPPLPPPPLTPPSFTPPLPPVNMRLTLTIANVRKEPALLFTITAGGELKFEKKLPPGEAIDVMTPPSTRWVAVFASAPHHQHLTFTPSQPIWLLRGPASPDTQPCENCRPLLRGARSQADSTVSFAAHTRRN